MIKLVTIFVRKPLDSKDLLSQQKAMVQQFHTHPEKIKINSIVELSHEDFLDFKDDLMADRQFLYEHRSEVILVKEKDADNYSGIIVQPSGFSYARYAGFPMKRVKDFKLCPRCGELYCEHPAISRRDNKTEICPKCGTEEAFLQFGVNYKYIAFLDELHNRANEFDIRIVVSAEGREDVVIEPEKTCS